MAAVSAPVVATTQGAISGLAANGLYQFRGIPYAQPPLGNLRWAAPEAPQEWQGVRDATRFGDVAPQAVRMGFDFQVDGESEDCLYLNVATRTLDAGASQPVMVWIHGGGNLYGAASDPLYDPAALTERGVTLVTFNYRLGVFGFLSHPRFGSNFAVLDYVAALRWVRQNIARFGGNPGNVTIFGQSAGAVGVRTLLACPSAEGLFHRAVIQSAGFEAKATGEWWSRDTNEAAATELFGVLETDDPAALCGVPTKAVLAAAAALSGAKDRPDLVRTPAQLVWMPVIDGQIVVDEVCEWARRIPVMLGTVENEARFFLRPERRAEFDRPLLERMTAHLAGPAASDVLQLLQYEMSEPYAALDALVTTTIFTEPAARTAEHFAGLGMAVFPYHFRRQAPGTITSGFLAAHASELPYLFGTLNHAMSTPYLFGGYASADWYDHCDWELADALQEAWVAFAQTGEPRSGSTPWQRFTSEAPVAVFVDAMVSVAQWQEGSFSKLIKSSRSQGPRRSWLGSPLSQ